MAKYLIFALAATLLVTCEAGFWSPQPHAQYFIYRNRDIADDPGYYQNRDANQQGYYYQNRDANQQGYYQNRDANQQGYYQNRDANQQGYRRYYYQNRDANQQGYYSSYYQNKDANQQQASSCLLQLEPPSKTFTICVRQDEICTNISVPACTSSATNCQQINNELLEQFKQINHDVYAQECMETTGGYCLYTDVTYGTCSSAKAMQDKFCVMLSDGTERCTTKTELENLVRTAGLKDGNLPSKP